MAIKFCVDLHGVMFHSNYFSVTPTDKDLTHQILYLLVPFTLKWNHYTLICATFIVITKKVKNDCNVMIILICLFRRNNFAMNFSLFKLSFFFHSSAFLCFWLVDMMC